MCKEYGGPTESYYKLGIHQLRLPTVDHFEPSVANLKRAVMYIRKYQENGDRVYVHCRAGHGRSAAVVLAWLMDNDPTADVHELNDYLCSLRKVRPTLWQQRNIRQFHRYLRMSPSLPVSLDPNR